jgi:hypothetical protein
MGNFFFGGGLIRHFGNGIRMSLGTLVTVLLINLYGRDANLHILTGCIRLVGAFALPDFEWNENCRTTK